MTLADGAAAGDPSAEVNADKASDHLTFDPSSLPPDEGQDGQVSVFSVPPGANGDRPITPFSPTWSGDAHSHIKDFPCPLCCHGNVEYRTYPSMSAGRKGDVRRRSC